MCKEIMPLPAVNSHYTNAYVYDSTESIQDIAATLVALTQNQTVQAALVVITLHFDSKSKTHTSTNIERSTRYYLENLRRLVRFTDRVFLQDASFYFLLSGANLHGASIVQERLWDALLWRVHNTSDEEVQRPDKMTIGYSACPHPHKDAYHCITSAQVARKSFDMLPDRISRVLTVQQDGEIDLPQLARQLGIPYLSLLPRELPSHIRHLVSPQLAQELCCYPVGRERNVLTVAMSNPNDNLALSRLQQETGLRIFPVLAHPEEIQTALAQLV